MPDFKVIQGLLPMASGWRWRPTFGGFGRVARFSK